MIRTGKSLLIDREQLKDSIPAIAGRMKFRLDIVEKDYYLTVIFNNIEALLIDKIVFVGGTFLNKTHFSFHYHPAGDSHLSKHDRCFTKELC